MEKFCGRLEVFDPIIEALRQEICEKEIKSEDDLEHLLSFLLIIGINELEHDDINSILNIIFKFMKDNTNKFPSDKLLDYTKQFLEHLSIKYPNYSYFVSLSWPNDLKIVVQRLFQTYNINQKYLKFCYNFCCLTSKALGLNWIKFNAKFATFLASSSSGWLRIIMENEENIEIEQLVTCLSILEDLMQSIDDESSTEFLNDETATSIGQSCQEAATFILECICELDKQTGSKMKYKMECFLVLYRFVSAFLAIGGAKIINSELLSSSLSTLLKICQFCIEQRNFETAGLLLLSLSEFKKLNENVLDVLLQYLRLIYSEKYSRRGIAQICTVLEQLKDKTNWFTINSLNEAKELAHTINDKKFMELIDAIKTT